jgi:proline iminopeptidase
MTQARSIHPKSLLGSVAPIRTPAFTDERGRTIPGSVAVMESVMVGGVAQRLWFRGVSQDNPVLVFLHGGPGGSLGALFRRYNADLERHFLVATWEQRGAGRSYQRGISSASMTIAQFVRDLEEVVQLVKSRFCKDKVVLFAHSWGTILGTLYAHQHPEDVAVYVGVGQIANMPEGERASYDWVLAEAKRRENRRALTELERIGPPPHALSAMRTERGWVSRFRGDIYTAPTTSDLLLEALQADEFNLLDLLKLLQGSRFSSKHLWPEISRTDLSSSALSFDVPMLFLLGRHDRVVPGALAAAYLERLNAPYKKLVWFERSAHNPNYEEHERFNRVIVEEVLSIA